MKKLQISTEWKIQEDMTKLLGFFGKLTLVDKIVETTTKYDEFNDEYYEWSTEFYKYEYEYDEKNSEVVETCLNVGKVGEFF